MRSIRRRGSAARRSDATGRSRRSLKFGVALIGACIAAMAFAISAGAVTTTAPSGVNGSNLVTTPDTAPQGYTSAGAYTAVGTDGLGVPAGSIKHVWVIVMENHAYETNFTGLNDNSYLSKTLPSMGAELTHYYGTGHSSLDNYLTMTSGQAPMTDDQDDCPAYTAAAGNVDTTGSLTSNGDYGQWESQAGPNAPAGDNGCVYPSSVPTLFNQLDANSSSWKVYAQDLADTGIAGQNGDASATNVSACGANDSTVSNGTTVANVGPTPLAGQATNPGASGSPYIVNGSANANDQYVAKHSPLPWFQSLIGTPGATDCTPAHLANMFDGSADQFTSDLASASTTPAFSYIVPDNCSNGHDAECAGNNLSGMASGANTNASEGTPTNSVGGSYASDLFLGHVVPEIINSPAYKAGGGLIAIVWDEAYPQFTYSNDSLADSTVSTASAFNSLTNDSAGETLFGKSLNWEPSGPNVPNVESQSGQQLSGGPGFSEYIHRPGSNAALPQVTCNNGTELGPDGAPATGTVTTGTSTSGTATTGTVTTFNGYYQMPNNGCYIAGGTTGSPANPNTVPYVSGTAGSSTLTESVQATSSSAGKLVSPALEGEQINALPSGGASSTPGPYYIGQVSSTVPAAVTTTGTDTAVQDQYPTVSFQLVDQNGNPVTLTSGFTNQTMSLGGQTTATDPLYDANDPTTGGGDTGAILISPMINPGTVSNTYYNHYSLLRSLEDMFQVSKATGSSAPYTGSVKLAQGLDGAGHLGYAAQPGLAPFGTDVFTASPLATTTVTTPASTVTKPVTVTAPGSTVTAPGSTITTSHTVTVSKTITKKETFVPLVFGLTVAQAEVNLRYAGLKLAAIKGPNPKTGYVRVVTAASPQAGTTELLGNKVTLTVKLVKNKKGE